MPDIIQLDIAPSAAILNSNDAALPEKTRLPGVEQPRFALRYSYDGAIQRAFWAWPLSRQARLGNFLGTGKIRIHWTANTTDTDNVAFSAYAGFVYDTEAIDKPLGSPTIVTTAFSGIANTLQVTEIAVAGLFSGLPSNRSGFFVLCIERDNTIGSNLVRTVDLQKSVLELDFASKLEVNGPVIASFPVIDPVVILTPGLLGYHIIVDTTVIGANALVYLASDDSVDPILPEHDGYSFWISKIGPYQVDIAIDPGLGSATTGIRGSAVIPIPLLVDGDSVRLSYTAYDNKYQVW